MKTTAIKRLFWFLAVNCLVTFTVHAQVPNAYELFRDTMTQIKNEGVKQIGGQSVDDLIQAAQKITIKVVPETQFQNLSNEIEGTYRGSGYWNKPTNTIYLSERHMELMTAKRGRWVVVHEFTEILGPGDKNFHKSALMDAVSTMKSIDARKPGMIHSQATVDLFTNRLNQSESGGVTGTGGGGDGRILSYMNLIYLELFFRVDRGTMSADQFNRIADLMEGLDVEFSKGVPQGTFRFDAALSRLRFPNDPAVGGNFNLNEDAISNLVDLWLSLTSKN
jgi:hypothetical protein